MRVPAIGGIKRQGGQVFKKLLNQEIPQTLWEWDWGGGGVIARLS